jgi:hypothetical protein
MMAWAGGKVRRWWPDRNPVRRSSDRAETAIVAGLLAAFLAGAPAAAVATDGWAHGVAAHVQHAQEAAWHQVPAVLSTAAVRPTAAGYPGPVLSPVRARWTAPDGEQRSGVVAVPPGTPVGHQVKVWVDSAGRLTGPPLRDHQVGEQAMLAGVVASALLGLLLLCAGMLARRVLDVRRMAAWDAEWRVTGPRWRSRH